MNNNNNKKIQLDRLGHMFFKNYGIFGSGKIAKDIYSLPIGIPRENHHLGWGVLFKRHWNFSSNKRKTILEASVTVF